MKKPIKKILIEGLILVFVIFFIAFGTLYAIIEPIAQSSYKKGYERGLKEECDLYYKFYVMNQTEPGDGNFFPEWNFTYNSS